MKDIKILDSPHRVSSSMSYDIQPNKTIPSMGGNRKKKRWLQALLNRPRLETKSFPDVKGDEEAEISVGLPLSEPEHTERIEIDMRHLAVTIGSSIDSAAQWKLFCDNGGSILPMLQCIMDAASTIEEVAIQDSTNYNAIIISEQHDLILTAASSACKTLRDLCTISKALSVVITDEILRYDAAWSKIEWNRERGDETCRFGGIISAMLILLRNSFETDAAYDGPFPSRRTRPMPPKRQLPGSRRQRKGKY
jgi:hypothetical protein